MHLPEETIIVTGFVHDVGRDIEEGLERGAGGEEGGGVVRRGGGGGGGGVVRQDPERRCIDAAETVGQMIKFNAEQRSGIWLTQLDSAGRKCNIRC
jgi:hypothetical protein